MGASGHVEDSGPTPELTIVIPAHNEARRIRPTLESYSAFFGSRAELLVVLNGCTDTTLEVVTACANAPNTSIRTLNFTEAIGKGGAVKEGFLAARGLTVGFVDADGATTPEEFSRLATLAPGIDGVIGSRWMKTSDVRNRTSPLRNIASLGFRLITKVLFHLPYADTQCGAKVFRRQVIEQIAPKLQNRDMTFDVELLLRTRAANFKILEVPTVWTDQSSPVLVGTPMKLLKTSFAMFRSLIQLRRTIRSI